MAEPRTGSPAGSKKVPGCCHKTQGEPQRLPVTTEQSEHHYHVLDGNTTGTFPSQVRKDAGKDTNSSPLGLSTRSSES